MSFRAIALAACLLPGIATASAGWTTRVDEEQGLPVVSKGGVAALTSSFAFWSKGWAWAAQPTHFNVIGPYRYTVTGRNEALALNLTAQVNKPSPTALRWQFDLSAQKTMPDAIGGGIVFKFDLAALGAELGEPELLPGNGGWRWGRADGTYFEMRFDPALPRIHFERGQKSEIRALFYDGAIREGTRRYVATLRASGDGQVEASIPERFGLPDMATWPSDILDWRTSPVDLSFLNAAEKPAGKHGFLTVVQDKLIFEDGTEVRFWGTNLSGPALFQTSRKGVREQARRLSQLGFNLVRLHHHDSLWVAPNIFGARGVTDTRSLDQRLLDQLDWWIKCLRDEGIYLWLDLHVGRQLKRGDGITDFDEISRGRATTDLKGYNYVNASIREAMKRFNEAYVSHLNSHTGLRYKDDPAIAAMLLTNENDVTHHFGNALLPDKAVPRHSAIYMSEAAAFAKKHDLPRDATWRSWEHGPSKLFLNDLEFRFNREMIAHLRSLGVKVPIVTTSTWGRNTLASLPALTAGDIVDVHAYGGVNELEKSPLVGPNLMHWMASAQVAGKPLSVSEWNVERFPVPDRHAIPLYIAAYGRLQSWNAVVQYAYAQRAPDSPTTASNWHAFNDPALLGTLPAAALLYRRGDVQSARLTYLLALSKEQFFGQPISPDHSAALRTIAEQHRLLIALPQVTELSWLAPAKHPQGVTISDPHRPLVDPEAHAASSDTGELRRNWQEGFFTIDTPRTQAAMGWIGGRQIRLSSIEVSSSLPNATVAVQSLDHKPISESRKILISLGARSLPTSTGELPFRSEPVAGRLVIRAQKGLRLFKNTSTREEPISVTFASGEYRILLDKDIGTYWLVLQ